MSAQRPARSSALTRLTPLAFHGPAFAALALAAVAQTGVACGRAQPEPPASASATGAGASAGAEASSAAPVPVPTSTLSPPPTVATRPPAVPAERPDQLAQLLPSDASALLLVDLDALRNPANAAQLNPLSLPTSSLLSGLAELLGDRLAEPELGRALSLAEPSDLALAWVAEPTPHWELAVPGTLDWTRPAGQPQPACRALNGATHCTTLQAFADKAAEAGEPIVERWPEASATAAVSVLVPRFSALPDHVRAELDFLATAEPAGLALSVETSGAADLWIATTRPQAVSDALGRAQAWTSQTLGQLSRGAEIQNQGWVTLGTRTLEGAWGRLTFAASDGRAHLRLAPPSCGTALSNLATGAVLLATAELGHEAPGVQPKPYTAVQAQYAEGCVRIPGPASAPPLALLGRLDADSLTPAMVVLADLGALARALAADGFGLLPFALTPEAVDRALGDHSLGFGRISEGSGPVALLAEWPGDDRRELAVLLPEAVAARIVGEDLRSSFLPRIVPGVGAVFSTPGLDLAARPELAASDRPPVGADTNAAIVLNRPLLRRFLADVPDGPSSAWLRDARWLVVEWAADGALRIVVSGPATPPDAAVLRGELAAILLASAPSQPDARATFGRNRESIAASLDRAIAAAELEAAPGVVRLTFREGARGPALAAAVPWLTPHLSTLIERGHIDLKQPVSPYIGPNLPP